MLEPNRRTNLAGKLWCGGSRPPPVGAPAGLIRRLIGAALRPIGLQLSR